MDDITASLRTRWPLLEEDGLCRALLEAWGSPERGYHDLVHLNEVLDRLDQLAEVGVRFDSVPVHLAAWFHDAVYDAEAGPEARSAAWARRSLAGYPEWAVEVSRLVLLTERHDPAAEDLNGIALCDADLAILAAGPERYAVYRAGVRREYARYDDATFAAGRSAVLQALADGPLFGTAHARRHWEPAARANLARELRELTDPR